MSEPHSVASVDQHYGGGSHVSGPPSVASSIVDHQHHVHQVGQTMRILMIKWVMKYDWNACDDENVLNLDPDIGTAERRCHLGSCFDGRRRQPSALLIDTRDGSPFEPTERRLGRHCRSSRLRTLKRHHRQCRARFGPPERLQRRSHVRRRTGEFTFSHLYPERFSCWCFC